MFLFAFFYLAGCSEKEELSENAKIAKNFLTNRGYEVIEHEKDGSHNFSKSDMKSIFVRQVWAVQDKGPDEYGNQRIDTVSFFIKNHPLDNEYDMGRTYATVWLIDGKVFGGWSYPISKNNDISGAPYSLNGKTADEIKTDYQKWVEDWQDKYGR
ncbi:hypothetical protein [Bacillus sp. B-jedd]|uniref:hypothetical protein n=1 Tax=Bacillus sp. B-jedd TaxID=1476857 RepID=UPI0011DCEB70|nr:hypothetical protein [Bacillus sp. B-jedd]